MESYRTSEIADGFFVLAPTRQGMPPIDVQQGTQRAGGRFLNVGRLAQ
jgi:hypothetical protein